MRLRHIILLASCAGAAGALLLAVDIHRRFQEAQRDALLNNSVASGADSVVNFGEIHMLGLLALAFLFLATVLLILAEPKPVTAPQAIPVAAAEPATPAAPEPAADTPSSPVSPAATPASNNLPGAGLADESNTEHE